MRKLASFARNATRKRKLWLLLCVAIAAVGALSTMVRPIAAGSPPGAQQAAHASYATLNYTTGGGQQSSMAAGSSQASSAQYAGADACKTCHESEYESWAKSRHYNTEHDTRGGPSKQGCEGCHGAGAEHVANPADTSKLFKFTKASSKEINAQCLTCHASSTQQMHAINSMHAKNDVSCTSCHSPHHSTTPEFLLVKAQPELCYSCHLQQKPQFGMPFHHRVNEGLIQCTDCHNPHGTVRANQVRTSSAQDAVCFTCHADLRGPFVFEHEPVKVEGCATCHTPHGSPNAHLLKVSNVNLLCLSCHTTSFANAPAAPSFHNQAAQYQACTLCHTQVHGSNSSNVFFR